MVRSFRINILIAILSCGLFGLESSCLAQHYDEPWNKPTICQASWNYKYIYFGMSEPFSRERKVSIDKIPPIPGLKYRTCYVMCQLDTCYASRAIIAIRCPEDSLLLNWVAKRIANVVENGAYVSQNSDEPEIVPHFKSAAEICNYYIRMMRETMVHKHGECGDQGVANEQCGFLLTDCWRNEKYCTFYESTWYDWLSCGDKSKETYYSINLETGRAATLKDFVKEENFPELAHLLMKYLSNYNGENWYSRIKDTGNLEPVEILKSNSGCALIREGLIICYFPYSIGSGADGQFNAIIPYEKLNGLLINN